MADAEQLSGARVEPVAELEALFPGAAGQGQPGEEDAELSRLTELVLGWLGPYEPLILWLQRLLVWERPLYSVSAAVTLNTLFWLISSTSLRPLFLLSLSLLGLMLLERWKHKLSVPHPVHPTESQPKQRGSELEPRLLSVPELSVHLADSYLTCQLYLRDMLMYKRHNHGKFCALMCCGCLVLAALGHYVPGVMISYIIVLSVLLWPLVVYHELIQRMYTGLEPIFMKLDYSMKGETELRTHDKRKVKKEVEGEPRAETESESEEEELCCFAPTVDVKTTALAMAITDSELSDEEASILESGGFSVSRATTPQLTDVSEDLDQQSVHSDPEESFLRDLPDFPSVEDFPQGDAPETLSPASLLLQHLSSPLHFVNTHFNGHTSHAHLQPQMPLPPDPPSSSVTEEAQRSLEALSQEIVTTAITTVVQNTLSALLREEEEEPAMADFLPELPELPAGPEELPAGPEELPVSPESLQEPDQPAGDSGQSVVGPTEDEDFELLDQSELEQAEAEELGGGAS